MTEPERKSHWQSLAEMLGAEAAPEPAPPAAPPAPSPPPAQPAKPKKPATPPPTPRQRASHWGSLAQQLGLDVPAEAFEPEPEEEAASAAATPPPTADEPPPSRPTRSTFEPEVVVPRRDPFVESEPEGSPQPDDPWLDEALDMEAPRLDDVAPQAADNWREHSQPMLDDELDDEIAEPPHSEIGDESAEEGRESEDEGDGQRKRRRRRRRRRGRGDRDGGREAESRERKETTGARGGKTEELQDDNLHDDDVDDDLSDDDEHSDTARPKHTKIPTWEQATGFIIDANLSNRSRSDHRGSRGRGGRGRR